MPTLTEISKRYDLSLRDKMDAFETELAKHPQTYLPLCHWFTDTQFPGLYLYTRQIFMPAGTIVTSRTHRVKHIFIISQGAFEVMNQNGKVELIRAPYTGVTHEGTRRVIGIIEDTIWTASFVTDTKDIPTLEDELTFTANKTLPKGFQGAFRGRKTDLLMAP
jgi:hypothetical protein